MSIRPESPTKVAKGHVIEDKLVQDTVYALLSIPIGYVVGGGTAVQTYLPQELHRVSTDVDVTVDRPLKTSDFREVSKPVLAALQAMGYSSSTRTSPREYFEIQIQTKDDALELQISKRTKGNFESNQRRIQRELANAVDKDVGYAKTKVLRPEDILLHKLMRVLRFEEKFGLTPIPKGNTLMERFDYVARLRTDVISHIDTLESYSDIANLRMNADLFDISALLNHQAPDKAYFCEALSDWAYVLGNNGRTRKVLMSIDPVLADLCNH